MTIQHGRFSVVGHSCVPPVSTAGAAHYDVTRANPTPFVIPTIAEAGATAWAENDEIFVKLSNENIERYVVVAGVPQFRYVVRGNRRFFRNLPPIANFFAAPNENTGTGDVIELFGADVANGYYEAVEFEPGLFIWIGRMDGVHVRTQRFELTAAHLLSGVTINIAPLTVWMTDVTNGLPVDNTTYVYTPATQNVSIPAGMVVGQVIEIGYNL